MTNQQPAATAGQPNGIYIDPNTAATLQQQGIPIPNYAMPGQPAQQTFQQPTPNPAPAGTMAAMGNQGWQVTNRTVHSAQSQPAYYAAPYQPAMTAAQIGAITAANGQTEPGSPLEKRTVMQQLQQFDGLLTQAIDEGVERRLDQIMAIMTNQQQQGVPQQQGQVDQPFFDTTTGKIVIGAGGVGVGVLGTKIFSNVFGGGNNSCSASDVSALANAFKQLLR